MVVHKPSSCSAAEHTTLTWLLSNAFFFMSGDSADKQEGSDGEKVQSMAEHLAMLDRVRKESEENRKFWKEELRSMNKWEKYGFG